MADNSKRFLIYAQLLAKKAGIRDDMAQRIMHSILPAVADPLQISQTEGVVDYNSLKAAADGRKKIIEYGTRAAVEELENSSDPIGHLKATEFLQAGKLEEAMDAAIKLYDNDDLWMTGYGGKLWGDISRSLRQLIRLDKTLEAMKLSPQRDHQKEVQIMRDIVVEMNVFDGLSHNSNSIMSNLVDLETEHKSKNREDKPSVLNKIDHRNLSREEFHRVKRLMDSKEIDDPVQVFKLIEEDLKESGNINKYKDWVSKIRRKDTFRKTDPELMNKLFVIFLRKAVLPSRTELNIGRDRTKQKLTDFNQDNNEANRSALEEAIDNLQWGVEMALNEFIDFEKGFSDQYASFDQESIAQATKKYAKVFRGLALVYADMLKRSKSKEIDKWASELLSFSTKVSFVLDSI